MLEVMTQGVEGCMCTLHARSPVSALNLVAFGGTFLVQYLIGAATHTPHGLGVGLLLPYQAFRHGLDRRRLLLGLRLRRGCRWPNPRGRPRMRAR